jgi:hypothetical protein
MKHAVMLLAAVATAAVVASAGAEKGVDKHLRGEFASFSENTTLVITGHAKLDRKKDGTVVKIDGVKGLAPDTTYMSHLHTQACADGMGGGHYQDQPGGAAAPPNELWLSSNHEDPGMVMTNHDGHAHARGEADWIAREQPLSVVIHELPSKTKIACADLT